MEKEKIVKSLDRAIEKQIPDVWDDMIDQIQRIEKQGNSSKVLVKGNFNSRSKNRKIYARISLVAAICIISALAVTFTPVLASIQQMYDKIFSSNHIDDSGVRKAAKDGDGLAVNQTYYDKKNDITVHFQSVLTDDKETKLLLTYQSKTTNLKNYYIDIFEGKSSIHLIDDNSNKKLKCVGWGSRYYNSKKNMVAEALSFESIKDFQGQNIRLQVENLTIYKNQSVHKVKTTWPLSFKLDKAALAPDRKMVEVNKEFKFENQTYKIKKVEFSAFETRVVVSGSDTKILTDETGKKYKVMSKLESKFLSARKIDKKYGYIVDNKKTGVFLKTAGKRVDPIFSKGEVQGNPDEYLMFFAPVNDYHNCTLEIGDNLEIPLVK
ncbi:DUF4179 domain-containing protein [Bacillus sp. FJAT-49736]|uniref:DUF4179 domain-containing protein n=1 Tax=Bacillus sp. FJAT-49736 TaxID=2833582 RepID=UPI001BC93C22|nr:DUF4179 domain-containing protein [Bacillus sp. FJAT-49736]MBS4172692.1 DUF4179 domain-containing protein [Bacillus sp. FJAT-49736]